MTSNPAFRVLFGLGALLVLAGRPAWALLPHTWRNSVATYAPIKGNAVDFPSPANEFTVMDLPFLFRLDGYTTRSIRVSRYGYMTIHGYLADTASSRNGDLFLPYNAPGHIIAPWWDELTYDSLCSVQWLASGVAPNRVFTIQFADYPDFRAAPNARMNFQVKLFEKSDRIQFLYGPRSGTPNPGSSASIGFKGGPGSFTLEGTTGSRTTARSALSSGADFPALNTVYTFEPDTAAPAEPKTVSGDGKIALSWRPSRLATATGYRVYTGDSPSSLALHDAILSRTDSSVTIGGLTNLKTYYLAVCAILPGGEETGFYEVVSAMPSLPPSIALAAPLDGLVARTDSIIYLTAEASDPDGTVAKVEYIDGKTGLTLVRGSGASWLGFWRPGTGGTYTVRARATDNNGAIAVSDPITIRIFQVPTVTLSQPPQLKLPRGTSVNVTATVGNLQPGDTILRVEFFDYSAKIGEDLSEPYTFDLVNPENRTHILSAYVVDTKGHRTQSNLVGLTIGENPSAKIIRPARGAVLRFHGPVSLEAEVADPDSLVGSFYFLEQSAAIEFAGTLRPPGPYAASWTPKSPGPKLLVAQVNGTLSWSARTDTAKILLLEHPEATLTAPAHFSAYTPSSAISFSAAVTAVDGSSPKVVYYRDSVLLGEAAAPPFAFTWTNPPEGRFRIQARVVDNTGDTGYSQAATIFVNDSAKAENGGRILVTGHDPVEHENADFLSAGLDFLLFGHAAKAYEKPFRKGARIAYLNAGIRAQPIRDYPPATKVFQVSGWDEKLFRDNRFDAIIMGTVSALDAGKEEFEKFLNQGGGIFIMADEGSGPSAYGFLPPFGETREVPFPEIQARTTVTPAGASNGWTEAIVNRDLYHVEFHDWDRTFLPFEIPGGKGAAITLGSHAGIAGGKFVPLDPAVADPIATARDTVFQDTLCIAFSSPTAGATLHLTRDGGNPDTSAWTLPNGGVTCVDRSATFRVIAKKTGWISSAEGRFAFRNINQVLPPVPDIASPYFEDSVCVRFTSATPGATFVYALGGRGLDTTGARNPNGDSVCLYASDTIRVMGLKPGMRNSDSADYAYTRRVAPTVDPIVSSAGDSAVFKRRLCFRLATRTDSARIAYSLDGNDPLASGLSMESGDSLCLEGSAVVVAVGMRPEWKNSVPARFIYVAEDDKLAILKSEFRPFDQREISVGGNCLRSGPDTLVLSLSEKTKPASASARWDRLALYSVRCDSNSATRVPFLGEPAVSEEGRVLTFLLDGNSPQPAPRPGGCVYLDASSGEFTDVVGKAPADSGVKIEGREKVTSVSLVRAIPPVSGLEGSWARGGCPDGTDDRNIWIPPSGFNPGTSLVDGGASRSCPENAPEPGAIPPCLSLLEVISDGGYVADFKIFDHLGNSVFASRQNFGACGELDDSEHSLGGQRRSYLVWNARDRQGARVGTGAYVWRIRFSSDAAGKAQSQTVLVRTGFLRKSECED